MLKSCSLLKNVVRLIKVRCVSGTGPVNTMERKISDKTTSNPLTLYGDYASPPARFVMITASLLNSEMNFHNIDLFKAEHKTDFYKKINPLQKVPALKIDDDNVICDSHAIALYLCNKAENQDLYPSDPLVRSQVDQLLFYNATTLFPIDSGIYMEYFTGVWPPDQSKIDSWNLALDYLESKLSKSKWLCGDKMLLADLCCGLTVSSLGIVVPLTERHEKVQKWMEELRKLPSFEIDKRGIERFSMFVKAAGPALN